MHELSIAWSILDQARKIAKGHGSDSVISVELDIGAISGIDIPSLEFILKNITRNEPAFTECSYNFNIIKVKKRCAHCRNEYTVNKLSETCSVCGSAESGIIAGNELRIASIEI